MKKKKALGPTTGISITSNTITPTNKRLDQFGSEKKQSTLMGPSTIRGKMPASSIKNRPLGIRTGGQSTSVAPMARSNHFSGSKMKKNY